MNEGAFPRQGAFFGPSRDLGIDQRLASRLLEAQEGVKRIWDKIESLKAHNFFKVLKAFRDARVDELSFPGTSGYGYGDVGRKALEEVYARVFGAEAALVRIQISSGTQAISLCLFTFLAPGDEVVLATGRPYDTLCHVMGLDEASPGSLAELGVVFREVALSGTGKPDLDGIADSLGPRTRVVFIQRSKGYALRPSLTVAEIGKMVEIIRQRRQDAIILVDNCYGEFVETSEPPEVGADIIAGSLIKNPGGGLAPTGGYVIGKRKLIERVAGRLTAPGTGRDIGPSLGLNRLLFQGLFLAPLLVSESIKGLTVAARLFEDLGLSTIPRHDEERSDMVQGVVLGSRDKLLGFCRGFHRASPVGAFQIPEAGPMPGYRDEIIMAGGTFVQGSSSELTADGPMRPPYAAFIQGGFMKEHVMLAVLCGLQEVL